VLIRVIRGKIVGILFFSTSLMSALHEVAEAFEGVEITAKSPSEGFKQLIKRVHKAEGKPVVILIDEYDRPIADYISAHSLEKARKQRDILKNFFSGLKKLSKFIRFLFITGVSKYARVTIFSDLNHLDDLTIDPRSHAICGYTQAELEHSFKPYLDIMPSDTLEKMKYWYDGYSWDGKTWMYNPFSVLNFFAKQDFRNYWFETGSPSFLVRVMRQRFEYELGETEVSKNILEKFRLEDLTGLNMTSLLLQTGYLTIKKVTPYDKYVLSYPNQEVKQSFGELLLEQYVPNPKNIPYQANILEALDNYQLEDVKELLHRLIQAIPDQNYISNEEKFIHAAIHLIFVMVGTDVRSEVHTPKGRIDTLVIRPNGIFILEYKVDESAEAALKCIVDRNYVEHLKHRNLPITGIGVSFSTKNKGIDQWKSQLYWNPN
jgi:Predicted AAA-ATPase/PD-(D/E)XK nuclease superfamily